jgi:hypothetical protein
VCGWWTVSRGTYPPAAEVEGGGEREGGRDGGGVLGGDPGVPDCGGVGVGGKREQGSEGETHHAAAPAAGDPGRRGAGHADQGDDRGGRGDSAHPQVADQQDIEEGLRGGGEAQYHSSGVGGVRFPEQGAVTMSRMDEEGRRRVHVSDPCSRTW